MAKARSPDSIEAEKLYHEGLKLVEIAEKLSVPAGTVRRWKSTQDWDGNSKKKQSERSGLKSERSGKKKSERSDSEQKPEPKKRGGQNGNKNATGNLGGGAPPENKNAFKHGAYASIRFSDFTDEEKEMTETIPDQEQGLIDEIKVLIVRERRIMQIISKIRNKEDPVVLMNAMRIEKKRTFKDDDERELYEDMKREQIASGERMPGEGYEIQTGTENKENFLSRLEQQLTTIQNSIIKAYSELEKVRGNVIDRDMVKQKFEFERKKFEGENDKTTVASTWVDAMMELESELGYE